MIFGKMLVDMICVF